MLHLMNKKPALIVILVILFALILSFATISNQVNSLTFRFIKVHQGREHTKLLNGVAGNPWQYRVLVDYMLEPFIDLFRQIGIDRPQPSAFISFRFLQNFFIFVTAFYYYKKIGLSNFTSFLGINILAWMMSHAIHDSDLAFNTYFDVLFYLLAAHLIQSDRYLWLLPLMLLAVLNRETSGLIIVLLPMYVFFDGKKGIKRKEAALVSVGMSIIYVAVFFGLRQYFDDQVFLTAYGYKPGKQLLYKNVVNLLSWQKISMTVGIFPFLALLSYPKWSRQLKIFFWTVVPLWALIHFAAAVVAETRVFLVPLSLIFIPATLYGLNMDKPSFQS